MNKEGNLHRKTLKILGLVMGLIVTVALLVSCYPVATEPADGEQAQQGGWTSILYMVGFIVLLFVMMYFLTIRPQRRRQQEQQKMIQELHKGDRVVTIGGMHGVVESVSEDSVVLRVESGTTLRFVKSAIANKLQEEPKIT